MNFYNKNHTISDYNSLFKFCHAAKDVYKIAEKFWVALTLLPRL